MVLVDPPDTTTMSDQHRMMMVPDDLDTPTPAATFEREQRAALLSGEPGAFDQTLTRLPMPAWHEAATLSVPGPVADDTGQQLTATARTLIYAARHGHTNIFASETLPNLDAAVRFIADFRHTLLDQAEANHQREWARHLEQSEAFGYFGFAPTDNHGTAWRLYWLTRRMLTDPRSGIERAVANQHYRDELEAIARHLPGHRTRDSGTTRNQRKLMELALTLGYDQSGRAIPLDKPSDITTTPPEYVVTTLATGEAAPDSGEPLVNLYISEAGPDSLHGLTDKELEQWGQSLAQGIPASKAAEMAGAYLGYQGHTRFGLAPSGSSWVTVYQCDAQGHLDDAGKPLIRTDAPDKLFAKTVDQLLAQDTALHHPGRTPDERSRLAQVLQRAASQNDPDYPGAHRITQLIEDGQLITPEVTLILHPYERAHHSADLICCSLANQLAVVDHPTAQAWSNTLIRFAQQLHPDPLTGSSGHPGSITNPEQ